MAGNQSLRWVRLVGVFVVACLLAACGASGSASGEAESGLRLTGQVDGTQIAVADSGPQQRVGDCALIIGLPADLCLVSQTIDGTRLVLGLGNPEYVASQNGSVSVARAECSSQSDCRAITDHAVVFVWMGEDPVAVRSGSLTVSSYDPDERFAGRFDLGLSTGRITGQFEVTPRPAS